VSTETFDRDTPLSEETTSRYTAVAWAVLFGAGTTLVKKVGTRYLMDEKMRLEWSDLTTVAVSAAVSYLSFRSSHDDEFPLG
jgi:hypothetical protein